MTQVAAAEVTYREAIRQALEEEMLRDDRVFILGEDIAHLGGAWRTTGGLAELFGEERVRDTPISESAIIGCAIGAALNGLIPIAEIQFNDLLLVCMDQIGNQVAKYRYRTGGSVFLPLVVRANYGTRGGGGPMGAQCLYGLFTHFPGLKVVLPSTVCDAKGLLKSAIRDPDPVLYFEHRDLFRIKESIPDGEILVPIGKAKVQREGRDLTIVASGRMLHQALKAAGQLAEGGIEAEVVDLRTLVPLDKETVVNSARKTGRLIVLDEGPPSGTAAEVGMVVQEEAFPALKAPIVRLTTKPYPIPYSPLLAESLVPRAETIVNHALALMKGSLSWPAT